MSNDALKIKKNELAERQRVMNEKNIQRAERKTNEKESKKICSMFTTIYFAIEQENVAKVEKLKKRLYLASRTCCSSLSCVRKG